jgi:uncharacterized protein
METVYLKDRFTRDSMDILCGTVLQKLTLYVVLALATIALQLGLGHPLAELVFTAQWPGNPWSEEVLLGLGVGIGVVAISRLASERWGWTQRIDAEFRAVLGPLSGASIFWLALMSSLVEELFFRGFLQPRVGLEAAALIFGLAHFPYRRYLIPWTIAAIGIGWFFGWIFESRGCLIAPILAHFVINYFNLHFISRGQADEYAPSVPWTSWGQLTSAASPPESDRLPDPAQGNVPLDE